MPATRRARFITTKSQGPAALAATSTNGGVDILERQGRGPYQLRGIDFDRRQNADHDAGSDGREQNVATRILDLLRERRDAVETYIGEHGDRGAAENRADVKGLGVIERLGEEPGRAVIVMPDIPSRADDEHENDGAGDRGQSHPRCAPSS